MRDIDIIIQRWMMTSCVNEEYISKLANSLSKLAKNFFGK